MNEARNRSLARLLAALDQEEQKFLLDWLADYAVHPADDVFISAALTARLIIEQQHLAGRIEASATAVVNAISQASSMLHVECDGLKSSAMSMRTEGAGWRTAATSGIKAGIMTSLADLDSHVKDAVEKMGSAIETPLAPVVNALDGLAALPDAIKTAATAGASAGAKHGAKAWLDAQMRNFGWRFALVIIAMVAMVFALGFGVARWTEPHVLVNTQAEKQHR